MGLLDVLEDEDTGDINAQELAKVKAGSGCLAKRSVDASMFGGRRVTPPTYVRKQGSSTGSWIEESMGRNVQTCPLCPALFSIYR